MKLILLGIILLCIIYSSIKPVYEGFDKTRGDKGEQGDMGPPGIVGEQGPEGIPGIDATSGDVGYKGQRGERGNKGIDGNIGPQGEKGDRGPRGNVGEKGERTIQNIWKNVELKNTLVGINKKLFNINKQMRESENTPINLELIVPNNKNDKISEAHIVEPFNNYLY